MKTERTDYPKAAIIGCAIAVIIISLCNLTSAQTFPRWPANTHVQVYLLKDAFTDKERTRISVAIESWRPLLPAGITLAMAGEVDAVQMCECVTFDREPTPHDKWGMTYAHFIGNRAIYTTISIDRRAGSGGAFQHSIEHELGHALGLDHRPKSVMSAGQVKQRPGEADAVILRAIYSLGLTAQDGPKVSPPVNSKSIDDTYRLDERFTKLIDISPVAQAEVANNDALLLHSFRRDITIERLDLNTGAVIGTYTRVSRMVLADNGERIERVLFKRSNLGDWRITKQDEEDFSGALMGLLDDFGRYSFHQLPGDTWIQVDPITLDGKRSFKGEIKLSDKGIVEFHGTTLPEGSERFPVFTAKRCEVEGRLFPCEASAEGVLLFPKIAIRYRMRIVISDYKKFGSKVSIAEVEQ